MAIVIATGQISQKGSTETLITMGTIYCEKDGLDEIIFCELNNDDMLVITITHELEHLEVLD